jgi:hypothetical protein
METLTSPEVTAETYIVEDYNLEVVVIRIRESRGRSWASCVAAKIPSCSDGDEHHVRVYRKNPPKCSCKAGKYGKICHAVTLVALIAEDNMLWKR